ncbi:MAG: amino acid permease, partial [Gemmatimonadetes bacterium]|nr:amino acid permease [Gemmatimonadota bacterium]
AAGRVVVIAGLIILVSSLNVNFLGMPRVAFALARDGMAPHVFTRVGPRGTPTVALLFVTATILALAVSGTFEFLIRFMMLVAISVDLVVLLGFFRLRQSQPDLFRPMRVPGYPWLPALAILLQLLVLVIIVATQPALAWGAGAMLGGLLVVGYFVGQRNR